MSIRASIFLAFILCTLLSYVLVMILPKSISAQDITNYYKLAEMNISMQEIMMLVVERKNPLEAISFFTSIGFLTLNMIIGILDFELYKIVFTLIINMTLFLGIKKNIDIDFNFINYSIFYLLIILTLPVFILYGYGWRQACAIGFYLCLRKGTLIDIVYIVVIALTFHLSVLIILGAELATRLQVKSKILIIAGSLLFSYLFFQYAPLYGEQDGKSLSLVATITVLMVILIPTVNDKSVVNSPIFIFSLSFLAYALLFGVGDLEMYRIMPILFIFLLIEIKNITFLGVMLFIFTNYMFVSFITQRFILDANL